MATISTLRPTLIAATSPGLNYTATYYRVYEALAHCRKLIHGKLENAAGETCAIGAYFKETSVPISSKAIDEIAAYNDSFPSLCPQQRWRKVRRWLEFEIKRMTNG